MDEAEQILQRIAKSKNVSHSGYFLLAQRDPDVQNGNRPLKETSIELDTKPFQATEGSSPSEKPPLEDLGTATTAAESHQQLAKKSKFRDTS